MKKQKENSFNEKFCLLNSQESRGESEEISWSCNDSSEYEDPVSCEIKPNLINSYGKKRKRVITKRKELTNISNLNVTVVDTTYEREKLEINGKSPILVGKSSYQKSPILTPSQAYLSRSIKNNPSCTSLVTSFKPCDVSKDMKNTLKSPIIVFKHASPKVSPRVKKKLFETANLQNNNEILSINNNSTSPTIRQRKNCLDRRKSNVLQDINVLQKPFYFIDNQLGSKNSNVSKENMNLNKEQSIPNLKEKWNDSKHNNNKISNQSAASLDSYVASGKNSHTELVAKVQSYFNSCFSSQTSQHSISECDTTTPENTSKSSDEVEIINEISQVRSLTPNLKDTQTVTSFGSMNTTKQKNKYKKDGLAFRLDALLKKQIAGVSLWQHERFLVENSKFVIPEQESSAFRIKKIVFNHSIYLLELVNENNEFFLLVTHSLNVKNNSFEIDNILKVYKPYEILELNNNCKIIVSVCKIETLIKRIS